MKPVLMVPLGALKNKPPHGQQCTRCGLCCKATICPLGMAIFRRQAGPCPALVDEKDGKYHCGVAANPMKYTIRRTLQHGVEEMKAAAMLLIGAGTGCDARFNGEPADEAFYKTLERHDHEHRSEVRAAKKMWGMK